jgi:hypothetical protein
LTPRPNWEKVTAVIGDVLQHCQTSFAVIPVTTRLGGPAARDPAGPGEVKSPRFSRSLRTVKHLRSVREGALRKFRDCVSSLLPRSSRQSLRHSAVGSFFWDQKRS